MAFRGRVSSHSKKKSIFGAALKGGKFTFDESKIQTSESESSSDAYTDDDVNVEERAVQKLLSDPVIEKAISDYITSLATPNAPALKIAKKINNQASNRYRPRASAMFSGGSPGMPHPNLMMATGNPISRSRHGSIPGPALMSQLGSLGINKDLAKGASKVDLGGVENKGFMRTDSLNKSKENLPGTKKNLPDMTKVQKSKSNLAKLPNSGFSRRTSKTKRGSTIPGAR